MIIQSLKMAWKAIKDSKMRSFLTMLGIIIGVFTLIVLVSLVNGATNTVTDSVSGLGSNLLSVSVSDDKGKPIRLEELDTFVENEEISAVAAVAQTSMEIVGSADEDTASVYGTTASYFAIRNKSLMYGRLLKSVDVTNHTMAAVLSYETAIDILGRADVVGEKIKLDGVSYDIIGVLAEETEASSMKGSSYEVYIPYTTLVRASSQVSNKVTSFIAAGTDPNSLDAAEDTLTELLLERFANDENAFRVSNQSTLMEAMETVTDTLSLLLGGIAGISLLVGGIGIMNIMLVSVTERTREIGIRKAVGAGRTTILIQFLLEALIISLMGCAVGIILSQAVISIINLIGDVDYSMNGTIVLLSILFAIFVGLVFGLYPANKAAKKKPIDALRYY